MSRPKVKDVTWNRIFHNVVGEVYQAKEEPMFYRVKINRYRKNAFFYGETASVDYQRYLYDETIKYGLYGIP